MPKAKIPTKPDTLKRLQKRARAKSTANAPAGKWSAEKAALARIAYEKQGGEFRETSKDESKRRVLDARRRRRSEAKK